MQTHHHPSPWHTFWSIVRAYERRDDLKRLTRWAERKQLSGPLRCYQNRLADEESRLFQHQVRRRRGSAARYKSRR